MKLSDIVETEIYLVSGEIHYNDSVLLGLCESWLDNIYQKLQDSDFEKVAHVQLPKREKPIGSGSKGIAFDIGGGKVLKITTDESEAKASSLIQGKKLPGIWNVYGVYKSYDKFPGYYFIVGEKLKPKPDRALKVLKIFGGAKGIGNTTFVKWTDSFLRNRLEEKEFEENQDASNVAKGMNSLYNEGIKWDDFKAANIMFRGNTAVIIDLGYSYSSQGKIKEF